ncbi:MAG: tetratricopeptide repeat protein, partial [Polyangia bacterium]
IAIVVALLGSSVTATLAPASAWAETQEAEVERLANEALSAYKGADYKRAVELLRRAYDIRQVPALLYNLAKAYDKLGDIEHAYDAYRQYVDSAASDPKLKVRAEARLTALEDARRKKAAGARAAETPPPPTTPPPQPAQVEPPRPPPPSAEELRARAHDEFVRDRRRSRLITIIGGGATVAFAAVALGLSIDALSLQHQFDRATLPADKSRLKSDATVRAGVADGFWCATAVAAGVTGYFAWRAFLRHEPAAPAVVLVPSLSPVGAGLAAVGRF